MKKIINRIGNQLMLLMLTLNVLVPNAAVVYAEASNLAENENVQIALTSLASPIYAGESTVFKLDFKVTGAMEEVNEALNDASSRKLVLQLPKRSDFYEVPANFDDMAITSLDKDGNKVTSIPEFDSKLNRLVYTFDSLRAGTSSSVYITLDTKNGVARHDDQITIEGKFKAGETTVASAAASASVKSAISIATTKSYEGIQDKPNALSARNGDKLIWSVRAEVPTTEMGMSLIKEGSNIVVEDTLDSHLSFGEVIKGEGVTATVDEQDPQKVIFTIAAPSKEEQLKLLENNQSLFGKEIKFTTLVKDVTEYVSISNQAIAKATSKEGTEVTATSNKPFAVATTKGAGGDVINGTYLYPAFYGPKNRKGGLWLEPANFDKNPDVTDTALLAYYSQYRIVPGNTWIPSINANDPGKNPDEEVSGGTWDCDDILDNGYQKIQMNHYVDKDLVVNYLKVYKPVLNFTKSVKSRPITQPVKVELVFNLEKGTTKTIEVDYSKLDIDKSPVSQVVVLDRAELGLTDADKVVSYSMILTHKEEGEMLDGKTALDLIAYYNVEPGATGQLENRVDYDVTLHDGTKIKRTPGTKKGNSASTGPRHVTIVEDTISAPTMTSDINFIEKDGSLVTVGDNRINFTISNMTVSGSALLGPICGNILLPKGVTVRAGDEDAKYQFINNCQQVTEQIGDGNSYEVIPNYNNTGRQMIKVKWAKDRINPREDLDFEININISKDAAYHLDLEGYILSNNKGYITSDGEGAMTVEKDDNNLDGNPDSENRIKLERTYVLKSKKDLQTIKLVKGSLDEKYSYLGRTTLGGAIDYKITLTNTTGDDITKLGFIDILPSVGDKTVLDNKERNSKFTPTLTRAIKIPDSWKDVEVYYSTATNPKRNTVLDKVDYPTGVEEITNPADAVDPEWQTAADVTDWSSIHSFKIELKPGTVMVPGQDITLEFNMKAPDELDDELLDVNTAGKDRAAWNSFAVTTNGLLATEPQRVGVYVEAGNVIAEYYIEDTDEKLALATGEYLTNVTKKHEAIGKEYSDTPPAELEKDGKKYRLVQIGGAPKLKKGSAPANGKVAVGTQTIQYQYKEVVGDVVVNYVNEKGDVIKTPVIDTEETSTGTDYDTTDNKPKTITTEDGKTYELVPEKTEGKEDGKVVEGTTEVTYVYKEVTGNVVVHYVDEDGNVIKTQVEDTEETSTGTEYDTTDNKPERIETENGKTYQLVPEKTEGKEDGKVVEGTTEVTYVYKLVVGSVTAEYYIEGTDTKLLGENGEEIKVVKPEGTPVGETYEDKAPAKLTTADGKTYVLVEVEGEPTLKEGSAAPTGEVAKEEQVIKYQYKEVKGDVVVNYVNEKGDVIKTPVTDTPETSTGTDYDTTDNKPKTITTEDGKTYELVPEKTEGKEDGKVVEGTTEVTYVYKEVFGDVVVNYVDEEGNVIKQPVEDTPETSTGTDYDTAVDNKPETITTEDGKTYELVPEKTEGTEQGKVVEGTTEVTYVYKEVTGDVVVHYVDEEGNTISVDVTDTPETSTGTEYDTAVDNKPETITTEDGKTYELVPEKTEGTEQGKVVEGTTEVTYVYKEVFGDVVVNYVDEEGNVIKQPVEDTPETSTGTEYDTAVDNKPETITTEDGKTYELVKTIGNETGKVVEGTTEVTYVYQLIGRETTPSISDNQQETHLPQTGVQSLLGHFAVASAFVTSGLAVLFKRKK